MRRSPLRLFALAVVLAGSLSSAASAAERMPRPRPAPEDATQARVIVVYKRDAALARQHALAGGESREAVARIHQRRADALARRAGVALTTGRAVGSRAHVVTARGLSSQALVERLKGDASIEQVVVDRRRRALMVPNDPLYLSGPAVHLGTQTGGPVVGQWYLRPPTDLFKSAIDAQAAWDLTLGSPDVVVAVLDTGVRFDHVDLQGRLLAGYDFISNVAYANDDSGRDGDASDPGDWITFAEDASGTFAGCGADHSSWHGTKIAGIIGAATNNGLGMAGVAPGVRILPVRVLGKCGGFDSDIAAGMRWAAGIDQPGLPGSATPARVLNMSLGGDGACAEPYLSAAAEVVARGAVVVVAAGNSVGHAVGTPANCPGVLAVAGLRHAGSKVGFSDLGSQIAIAAPGGNCVNVDPGTPCLYPILTTSNSGTTVPEAGGSIYTDSFNITVGTSFATPQVAGTAALMLSKRPELTPAEVKAALQASARPFPQDGADNGTDPTPVTACLPPAPLTEPQFDQLQCYCPNPPAQTLCGAGMLDAPGALARAINGLYARIAVTPAAPVAGTAIQLSAASSLLGAGRSAATWEWTLVSGGGAVSAFSGATNAATATLQPTAAGTIVVRLTLTDDLGARATADGTITVTAAPVVQPPPSSGGGGGAMSAAWLALLALAARSLGVRARRACA